MTYTYEPIIIYLGKEKKCKRIKYYITIHQNKTGMIYLLNFCSTKGY